MKIERWEEETDEEWNKRLAEETAIANNTETTKYFIKDDPTDETQFIINYVGEDGLIWKEHPEGPFNAKQVLEWKKKAEMWDEICEGLEYGVNTPVGDILQEIRLINRDNQKRKDMLEAVETWKYGMFVRLPLVGKGHISRDDLDRLGKILKGEG